MFLLFYAFQSGLAQLFSIESSLPPGTDWQQIKTDSVRVVFPRGLEEQAARIADLVLYMGNNHNHSIGGRVKPVDVFLLNHPVISNGYVAAPPLHSKFFTQAPQESFAGTTDWLDLLTIHEYRHVMQYHNAFQGISRWLYYVFGETVFAGAAHLASPPWFWEGDAVVQETLLSHSGRGRIPGFGVYLQTIADLEVPFPYEKMVCGSFNDVIPNHYYLGYELSLFGRTKYGNDFWRSIYQDAAAFDGILWPFSESIREKTGFRTRELYRQMMEEKASEPLEPGVSLAFETEKFPKRPTTYSHPRFRDDDKVVALKEDYNRPGWIVEVTAAGTERKLFPEGFSMGRFDASERLVVWNEMSNHPRWSDLGYSDLYVYDHSTEKIRKLTDKGRYFAPAIAPNGKEVLLVESDEQMHHQFTVLDLETGDVIRRMESPGNGFPTHPCWLSENQFVFVSQLANAQCLLRFDLNSGQFDTLVPPQRELIEYLSYAKGKIYFSSNARPGHNLLMELDPVSGERKENSLFSLPYLMEMPEVSPGGKLVFINTHFNQKTLAITEVESFMAHQPTDPVMEKIDRLYGETRVAQALQRLGREEGGPIPDTLPSRNYAIKKYKAGFSKLKWHSWIPSPVYPEYSVLLQANDALGTTGVFVQPGYNLNEKAFFTNVHLEYGAYYPKFDLGFSSLLGRSVSLGSLIGESEEINWNEIRVSGAVTLPLQYTRRNYVYGFRPLGGYRFIRAFGYRGLGDPDYHVAFLEFAAAAIRKRAYRSIRPAWSTDAAFSFQKTVNTADFPALSAQWNVYLPGLHPVHSSYLEFDFKYQDRNNEYLFPDTYAYAGGYDLRKTGNWIAGAKAYYAFPIVYPDLAVGPLAFVKRIRMNVNYKADVFPEAVSGDWEYDHTIGFQLVLDARYLRLFDLPLGIGVDYGLKRKDDIPISLYLVFE